MSVSSPPAEAPAGRPIRLVKALLIGVGLVAGLTLVTSCLAARSEPAISGSVYLMGDCPGQYGDLTGTTVTVTSSTGQVVTTQLGPPAYDESYAGPVLVITCDYDFEIRDPIPGATLTFEIRGCSVTFRDEPHPMIGLDSWECTHGRHQ